MAVLWSKEEVLKLVDIWGDEAVQAQLEGCRRNQEVYNKIAAQLRAAGFERTGSQCRDKIKKLKIEYRKIKDKRNKTGEGRFPEWHYFDSIDEILGHRPATQPPVVVSSVDNTAGHTADDSQQEERKENSPELFDDIKPSESSSSTMESSRSSTPVLLRHRKRQRSKADKVDSCTTEMITKLVKVQEQSDQRLIELEERRIAFEEHQLEKEAQQRKEEREFQLRMIQLMMGQGYTQPHPSPSRFGELRENPIADRMYSFPLPENTNTTE